MAIVTPGTAVVAGELTESQRDRGKMGIGVMDNPIQPNRTYIVFDAVAGNNNLHLDTSANKTYSINTGEGRVDIDYTDTGGIKVLTFDTEGRYVLTIKGDFAGIDTSQTTNQAELNKYIDIYAGSNHPTTLVTNAFKNCLKLQNATFTELTTIGITSFYGCSLLKNGTFPKVTSIGLAAFLNCAIVELHTSDIVALMQNKVGIGVCPATAKVHILQDGDDYDAGIKIVGSDFLVSGRVWMALETMHIDNATAGSGTGFSLNKTGNVGLDKLLPNHKFDVNGDINADGDIFCDDLTAINIEATGNVESDTIVCDGLTAGNIEASGNIEAGNIEASGNIEGDTISENGTQLSDKYYYNNTLPAYDYVEGMYGFGSVIKDRKPSGSASAFNMWGSFTSNIDLQNKHYYTDVVLLTSTGLAGTQGLSFNGSVSYGEKIYLFNEGNFNISLSSGPNEFGFDVDSTYILKPKKWVMIMYPPESVGTNKWTLFPSA